jgi:hypothetical protein
MRRDPAGTLCGTAGLWVALLSGQASEIKIIGIG